MTSSYYSYHQLYVYSLGASIYHAAQYGQTGPNLPHSLNAILMAMCDQNAASRVPLMTVLEVSIDVYEMERKVEEEKLYYRVIKKKLDSK